MLARAWQQRQKATLPRHVQRQADQRADAVKREDREDQHRQHPVHAGPKMHRDQQDQSQRARQQQRGQNVRILHLAEDLPHIARMDRDQDRRIGQQPPRAGQKTRRNRVGQHPHHPAQLEDAHKLKQHPRRQRRDPQNGQRGHELRVSRPADAHHRNRHRRRKDGDRRVLHHPQRALDAAEQLQRQGDDKSAEQEHRRAGGQAADQAA